MAVQTGSLSAALLASLKAAKRAATWGLQTAEMMGVMKVVQTADTRAGWSVVRWAASVDLWADKKVLLKAGLKAEARADSRVLRWVA